MSDLSSLQAEAKLLVQQMKKEELELFIKRQSAVGQKGRSWYRVGVIVLLACYMLVCGLLCGYRIYDYKEGWRHRVPPVVVLILTTAMMFWSWAYLKGRGEEFEKVVLGDMVILVVVGIAMWKGDLSIIAGLGENWYASRKKTLDTLEGLAECLEADTCTDGQGDIVLAGSMHFGNSLGGGVSGEDIWARSSIDAFRELGRTVLISYTLLETLDIYQAIPKLISRVIIDRIEVDQCVGYGRPAKLRLEDFAKGRARNMTDEEMLRWELQSEAAEEGSSWGFKVLENQDAFERGGCIRREGYPQGIPLWKIFSFHFWQGPGHPLGRNWTLSPEDYKKHPCQNGSPGNFYLGYSVEKYCQRFVDPPEQRLHRAYILAKYVHILDSDEFAWDSPNKTLFADLSEKYNISFVAGADHQGDVSIQKGIANMGRMPEDEFYKELALGRLVVGVGMPMISPTPYDALCLGVPFLNPLWRWDEKNPADSSAWCSQHDGLLEVGAPYVYHVRKRDLAHFEEAVAAAMERTIDPYIPPHMTADANRKRHQELLERDWESESVPFMAALQDDRFQMGIY